MGMDLKPIAPKPDAPKNEQGTPIWGRYNWTGWQYIINLADRHGVDVSKFSGVNDGEEISAETCMAVADAIERAIDDHELSPQDVEWLTPHILLWRTCGGYCQF